MVVDKSLAERAVNCGEWRWIEGMLAIWPNGNEFRVGQVRESDLSGVGVRSHPCNGWGDEYPDQTKGLPDLSDPATKGCILSLIRKAWGDPYLYVHCIGKRPNGESWRVGSSVPEVVSLPSMMFGALSEQEALVLSLEARK